MNSFIYECVIYVLGFLTSSRSGEALILALLFRQTRPDPEIPAHLPSGIDRASPARVRSTPLAGHPSSHPRLACNTAEVPGVPSPAIPACPGRASPRAALIPECPRNSPCARSPWKFASPALGSISLPAHSIRKFSRRGRLPQAL